MRRGISHATIGEQRSEEFVASDGSAIQDDAAQAASWTARLIREVTGEQPTVHLVTHAAGCASSGAKVNVCRSGQRRPRYVGRRSMP